MYFMASLNIPYEDNSVKYLTVQGVFGFDAKFSPVIYIIANKEYN